MNKTLKAIIWLIILVLVIWGLTAISQKGTSNKVSDTGPIKIGFMGALTGDAADYGEPQRNAIELAADEINKNGGIGGRQVEVIYEDSKCTGEGGVNAAQKLANVDKVKIILGGSCSSETLSALPVITSAKVFMITGSASSPDLINRSPFFARDYPNDSSQGIVLADAADKRGWKKMAILQEQTDYALGVEKAFSNRFISLGDTIVKEEFPSSTSDFRQQLTKLQASNPGALFIIAQSTASAGRILAQLPQVNWKPVLIVNDVPGSSADFVTQHKDQLEGTLYADFFLDPTNPKLTAFNQAYKGRFGKEVAFASYTNSVYDSLYIVKDAISAVGYDSEKIAKWVRTLKDWQGASGSVTIGSDGERVGGFALKIIKEGKGGLAN